MESLGFMTAYRLQVLVGVVEYAVDNPGIQYQFTKEFDCDLLNYLSEFLQIILLRSI